MLSHPVDLAMVKAIDEVAKIMGLSSIAEHVESKELFQALQDIGVDEVQGYWIGRPVSLLEARHTPRRGATRLRVERSLGYGQSTT
ncbi:MAG: EAL domain-containing protein [Chromatiales bacterium]|jgi:EAL domain-containing protein (putative c-di-GMP-specific phosphodiesterase class I)|nr:EAL domain-containing protein [Chromatiales bacterium]